jgi:hypothetical protein
MFFDDKSLPSELLVNPFKLLQYVACYANCDEEAAKRPRWHL